MIPYHYILNSWYVAGFSDEFAVRELKGHKICEKPIVTWRTDDGKVVAFDNRCRHKRMPLSEGRIMPDGTLECAYHGLCYDAAGKCTLVPSHPDGKIPRQLRLKPFPVIEQDGLVWIWPGDPEESTKVSPPRTPEIESDEWESIHSDPMNVRANYLLLIENLMDITHFYPLHDGNIGDIDNSRIPIQLKEGTADHGNRFVKTIRETSGYRQPPFLEDWFVYDVVDREHTHCMVSPGLTRVEMRVTPTHSTKRNEEVRGYTLFHTHTPIDDTHHLWRWCVNCKSHHMSKGNPDISAAKRVSEMFPEVVAQDLWALEKQQEMFDLDDDGYTEVFLKPDMALRRIRQLFVQMQRAEQQNLKSVSPSKVPVATVRSRASRRLNLHLYF